MTSAAAPASRGAPVAEGGEDAELGKPVSEIELLRLQIQAYEFYAGLIDRAVVSGAHDAKMPRWDEQRAVEYMQLAEQLRARLAELEAAERTSDATVPAN